MSSFVRRFLTRSVFITRSHSLLATRVVNPNHAHKGVVALVRPGRAFSVSAQLAFPEAKSKNQSSSTDKKSTAHKAAATKKKTARASAKQTKKKAAPKKRKVAAKKKPTKRKSKAKKVVPKQPSPRTDSSLRAPPRALRPFTLYVKRMWPTLTPKPANAVEGMAQLRTMWNALTPAEKKPFEDEAAVISNERRAVYDQWRTGLSPHQVKIINQYRTKGKHSRLGPKPSTALKRPITGYIKFYKEKLDDGTLDPSKTPEGTQFIVYASKEASRLWKELSESEKQSYKS